MKHEIRRRRFSARAWTALAVAVLAATGAQAQRRIETLAVVDAGTGGLETDGAGNVYSSDFGPVLGGGPVTGTRIHRITPEGGVSVFAEGFQGASGNAFDSHGILFQSNIRGGYLSKVTPDGQAEVFSKDGFQGPVGIAIDARDTLWVANCGSNSIQKVSRTGESSRFVESPLLACPNGITLAADGNLYVANFYNGDVVRITPEAVATRLATLPGNNNGHLVFHQGALLVAARTAHQIYRVTLTGEISLVAGSGEKGSADGPALEATLCYPNDLAVSPDGVYLYINEIGDVSSEGTKLTPTRIRRLRLAP